MKHGLGWMVACCPAILLAGDFSTPGTPPDAQALAAVHSFIPKDWEVLALARGDLNADQAADYAVVVQRVDTAGQVLKRRLLMVLSEAAADSTKEAPAQSVKLSNQYWRFIPVPAAGAPEPLAHIGIRAGALELRFQPAAPGRTHLSYQFRREGRRFVLSQFEHYSVSSASGMFRQLKADVQAGTQERTSGSMSSPRHRKEQIAFVPSQVWTPCNIPNALEFEP